MQQPRLLEMTSSRASRSLASGCLHSWISVVQTQSAVAVSRVAQGGTLCKLCTSGFA